MKISSLFSSANKKNKWNNIKQKSMDLIIFERKAFEEFATKIEQFILRVSNSD